MKQKLLSSSALAAATLLGLSGGQAAADGIEIQIRGFLNTYFSAAGIDNGGGNADALALIGPDPRDFNSTGVFSDGEIQFRGSYTADNGITFGVRVELEAGSPSGDANNSDDTIDERFIFVQGDFGRIEAGSTNTAAYKMHVAAPFVGVPINSGWFTAFIPGTVGLYNSYLTPQVSTYLDYGNDENTISYYTPRFAGFQLGLSYSPSVVDTGDGKDFPVEADRNDDFYNGFAVGLNYVQDFNGFGVSASAGYRRASTPKDLNDFLDLGLGIDGGDVQMVCFGLQLSYGGFMVGGSYANQMSGPNFGLITTEGQSWDVGASYSYGPWHVGATYFHSKVEGYYNTASMSAFIGVDTTGDSKVQAATLGLAYDLGPGIELSGTLMWASYDTEFGYTVDGVAGILGTKFSF